MIIAIICGIIAFLALILLIVKVKSDALSIYDIKIQEAEKEIENLLGKELSLLSELHKHFTENNDAEFNFLSHLDEVEDNEFKLNSIINKAYKELKDYLDDRRSYIPSDDIKISLEELTQCDIECIAVKKYYNDKVIEYNNKIKKFPNKIIAKFIHLQKKEIYNDPVEEEFEILKKK